MATESDQELAMGLYQTYEAINRWAQEAARHPHPILILDEDDTFEGKRLQENRRTSHGSDATSGGALGLIIEPDSSASSSMAGTATSLTKDAGHINAPTFPKPEPVIPNLSRSPIVQDALSREYIFLPQAEIFDSPQRIGTKRNRTSNASDIDKFGKMITADNVRMAFDSSDDEDDQPSRKRFKSTGADISLHKTRIRRNRSNLALIRMNHGYPLSLRFMNKAEKFERNSLPHSDLPWELSIPTRNQDAWTTGLELLSAPNEAFTLPSPQSSLPSLQEVLGSASAGSESLDLPPPQILLPSFDEMFKTPHSTSLDVEMQDRVLARERDCVVDIFPIRF